MFRRLGAFIFSLNSNNCVHPARIVCSSSSSMEDEDDLYHLLHHITVYDYYLLILSIIYIYPQFTPAVRFFCKILKTQQDYH